MSFDTYVGQLTKTTSGAPVDQAITGIGFLPKLVIMWSADHTANGSYTGDYLFCFGASDGLTDYSACSFSEDNVDPSNCIRRHALKAYTAVDSAAAVTHECDMKSLDADGFTLTWTTNDAVGTLINFVCLGGSDLVNVYVGYDTAETSIGTAKSYTGVGFEPDSIITFGAMNGNTSPSPSPPSTQANTACIYIGAAQAIGAALGDGGAICTVQEDNVSSHDTETLATSGRCITVRDIKTGIPASGGNAYVQSWDVDGFTLFWVAAANVAFHFGFICLKGLQYDLQQLNSPTSTGIQAITGMGFAPSVALFFHGSAGPDAPFGIGASYDDGGAKPFPEACAWAGDEDNPAANTACDRQVRNDKVMHLAEPPTPTTRAQADLHAWGADGLTLDWTTVHTSGLAYRVFALGSPAGLVSAGAGSQVDFF